MDRWLQDVRFAARHLRKAWAFTVAAVVTLALGIGANATLFSLADSVLFRPFPFPDQDRLVIGGENQMPTRSEVSHPDFLDWQARSRAFDGLAAMGSSDWTVTLSDGDPVRVAHRAVSGGFFEVLGAAAALGRTLSPADDRRGAAHVLVISHGLWQRQFGGDRAVIGRSVVFADAPFTIVGVMPPGFTYPVGTEAWSPLIPFLADNQPPELPDLLKTRTAAMLHVVGRLKAGVDVEAARSDLDRVIRELAVEHSRPDAPGVAARLTPLVDDVLASSRPGLWALLGSVLLLLLVASANVAGLMIVQASQRRREFVVRMALGASRVAVARQLLWEALILAAVAAVAAVLIASAGVPLVRSLVPQDIPRVDLAAVNSRVIGFTALAGILSAVLCWIGSALTLDSGALDAALRSGSRTFASGGFSRPARRLLVAFEIAAAIVILTFAGLLYRSVSRLDRLDIGFRSERLLAAELDRPAALSKAADDEIDRFYERVADAVSSLPGVEMVGAVRDRPLKGPIGLDSSWRLEGQTEDVADRNPWVNVQTISPTYFATLRTPLIAGRLFDDGDRETTQAAAIVNESLAKWAWPGQSPLGKRVWVAAFGRWSTVIGVVADIRYRALESARFDIYAPYRQSPFAAGDLMVRTREHAAAVAPLVRERVRSMNPGGAIRISLMEDVVAAHRAPWRANMTLFGLFAVLTIVLAIVGVYAVLASTVVEQSREIGVRLALGAGVSRIVRMVLTDAGWIALAGAAVGVPAAIAGGRLIRGLLFEVSPLDAATLAAAPVVLFAVAMAACALPALRAARVDPAATLRAE